MMNYIRVSDKEKIHEQFEHLANRICAFWNWDQHVLMVEYKPYEDPRTRSQNGLYWMWLGEMASYFSSKGGEYDKDDMHDLMRHRFLGYADKVIGNTVVKGQLRSTTKLNKPEMAAYMTQVEAWAIENGLRLTIPHSNEYFEYREASQ